MADEDAYGRTELNSVGMLIGGSITTAIGVGTLGTGLGLFLAGDAANEECQARAARSDALLAPLNCPFVGLGEQIIGIPMMIGGGVMTLVGVPLVIAGAWPVPVEDVEVAAGPGSLGLRGSF